MLRRDFPNPYAYIPITIGVPVPGIAFGGYALLESLMVLIVFVISFFAILHSSIVIYVSSIVSVKKYA